MTMATPQDILSLLCEMHSKAAVGSLGPDDNLLENGIDSLDMMNLFFSLEERFAVRIVMDEAAYRAEDWATARAIAENVNRLQG